MLKAARVLNTKLTLMVADTYTVICEKRQQNNMLVLKPTEKNTILTP